jgi:hypothetical protein
VSNFNNTRRAFSHSCLPSRPVALWSIAFVCKPVWVGLDWIELRAACFLSTNKALFSLFYTEQPLSTFKRFSLIRTPQDLQYMSTFNLQVLLRTLTFVFLTTVFSE